MNKKAPSPRKPKTPVVQKKKYIPRNQKAGQLKMRLLKDIIIPAGTIFHAAPSNTERAPGHVESIVGLTKDTAGEFTYFVDPGDPSIKEWFVPCK